MSNHTITDALLAAFAANIDACPMVKRAPLLSQVDALRLAMKHRLIGVVWQVPTPAISQDDRDAVFDALLDIHRCEHCDSVLAETDLRPISGTQWNGCDVDETCYACSSCGKGGVL